MKKTLLLTLTLCLGLSNAFAAAKTEKATDECKSEEHYPLIEKTELKELLQKDGVYLVDVNSKKSYEEHHIGKAIHFAAHEKDFTQQLPADKNALIVAYCGNEKCTAWKKAAEIACNHGYKNVKHFKPGIQGWVATR